MNLKRVEELTGKFLHFYNEDIMDMAALQNIFKRVILFLFSSFFSFNRMSRAIAFSRRIALPSTGRTGNLALNNARS